MYRVFSPSMILKFHKGNKQYPQPAESQFQFNILDTPLSKIRIVLLVQIGKEGWDCRSLTGIILSQEGDCPKNMVLQTSCRCLRQVERHVAETAMIYLNEGNAKKLETQLKKQHHISLQEFQQPNRQAVSLNRYDRMKYLHLPSVNFYQLIVRYEMLIIEEDRNPGQEILASVCHQKANERIETKDFNLNTLETTFISEETGTTRARFFGWLYDICKTSFGSLTMQQLEVYREELHQVFNTITYEKDGVRYFSSRYDLSAIEEDIRKAFYPKRRLDVKEEVLPEKASLLVGNLKSPILTESPQIYYPNQESVERIIQDDVGEMEMPQQAEEAIKLLESIGNMEGANSVRRQYISHPQKDRSFHYLPYKTDSNFERIFLEKILPLDVVKEYNLEVYYNGDGDLTDFQIKCYAQRVNRWRYIGKYTPDFLIIRRKNEEIHQAIIVETKGALYALKSDFQARKTFVESEFIRKNNEKFGYRRFDYLYLEDSMSEAEWLRKTRDKIQDFFGEE